MSYTKQDRAREDAQRVLTYYFRICAEKAGVRWTSDNDAEVRAVVDDIIQAARDP